MSAAALPWQQSYHAESQHFGKSGSEPTAGVVPSAQRNLTVQQLAARQCAIAVNGAVYDVSSLEIYAPGGRYEHLTGRDASYAIATSTEQVKHVGTLAFPLSGYHSMICSIT